MCMQSGTGMWKYTVMGRDFDKQTKSKIMMPLQAVGMIILLSVKIISGLKRVL